MSHCEVQLVKQWSAFCLSFQWSRVLKYGKPTYDHPIPDSFPVFQSQLNLLNEYTEAEEILKALKEVQLYYFNFPSLNSEYYSEKKNELTPIARSKIGKNHRNMERDERPNGCPNGFFSAFWLLSSFWHSQFRRGNNGSVFSDDELFQLSMINADRSMNLLCDVLKSVSNQQNDQETWSFQLAKRVEICDPEVQLISNVLWFLYSAMSIMNTLPVDQEYTTVEKAFQVTTQSGWELCIRLFQTLAGILNGKTVAEEVLPAATSETFNRRVGVAINITTLYIHYT